MRWAAELERLPGSPEARGLARDWVQSLRAQVSWHKGSPEEALKLLEQAPMEMWRGFSSGFLFRVHERYLRAELLRAVGRDDEALGWYAGLGEISTVELPYLAPSYFRRAEIYESMGEREKAIHHYSRFIELWEDCDPELRPMVEDAQRRIEALLQEPAAS